jgi:23S rRNA pseudouridine2605 synthase
MTEETQSASAQPVEETAPKTKRTRKTKEAVVEAVENIAEAPAAEAEAKPKKPRAKKAAKGTEAAEAVQAEEAVTPMLIIEATAPAKKAPVKRAPVKVEEPEVVEEDEAELAMDFDDDDDDDEEEVFPVDGEDDDEDDEDDVEDETENEAEASDADGERAEKPEGKLERLQKILSKAGISSRRHAEELIEAGRVQVNGEVITALGIKADAQRDHIRVDGKLLQGAERHRYFMLNKPKGFVTTVSDPEGRPTVMQFFEKAGQRLYPVGRLDYLSEGLLFVTNDGELANQLSRAGSGVEKTYLVKVSGQPTEEELEQLRAGVSIERAGEGSGRVRTAPARIRQVREGDNPWFEVILIEGRNRELRKMFSSIGHFVEKIRRVGYGPLILDLEPGKTRELDADEVEALRLTAQGKFKPRRMKTTRMLPKEAGRTFDPQGEGDGRRKSYGSKPFRPSGDRKSFGSKPRFGGSSSRPAYRRPEGENRPPQSDRVNGELRDYTPRPRPEYGDRPQRSAGNGERRDFAPRPRPEGDRPQRSYGDRPQRPYGGGGERREFTPRPRPEGGDRTQRSYGDRPQRPYGGGERREFTPRPRPEGGDRPQRSYGDRPQRPYGGGGERREFTPRPRPEGGDRPQRSYGDRPQRSFEGGERREFTPRPRPEGDRGPSTGRPAFGGKPSFGSKPGFGSKPRPGGSGRPSFGGKKPGGFKSGGFKGKPGGGSRGFGGKKRY